MTPPNLTVGLWLGNALGAALLLLAAFYQFGGAVFGAGARLPQVQPLVARPVPQPSASAGIGARNPFDPSIAHWRASGAGAPALAGELRGVILLPGVRAVVTNSGTVRPGETMTEGRVIRILDNGIIVEQGQGNREIKLPSAGRPTLQSLNKAGTAANKTIKGTQ